MSAGFCSNWVMRTVEVSVFMWFYVDFFRTATLKYVILLEGCNRHDVLSVKAEFQLAVQLGLYHSLLCSITGVVKWTYTADPFGKCSAGIMSGDVMASRTNTSHYRLVCLLGVCKVCRTFHIIVFFAKILVYWICEWVYVWSTADEGASSGSYLVLLGQQLAAFDCLTQARRYLWNTPELSVS